MTRRPFTPQAGGDIVLPANAARAIGRFSNHEGGFGYQASNLFDAPLRQARAAAEGDYLAALCIPTDVQTGELRYVRSDANDDGINTIDLVDDVHRYTVRDDGTFTSGLVLPEEARRLAHVEDQRMKAVEALVGAGNLGTHDLAGNLQRDAADAIAAIMHLFGDDGAEVLELARRQYESELV